MTTPRPKPYDPNRPVPRAAPGPAAMITASAINRLSRDMRAALGDLLAHGELVFAAGHYMVPGGARYLGRTIGALVQHDLVVVSSPALRHSVARLTLAARPLLRTALALEAGALARVT